MKTIIATLIAMFFVGQLFAQKTINYDNINDQEINTLFKKNKRDGFYGAFSMGYSPIDNKDGLVVSTRGSWIMDHWFAFGIGATGFVNNVDQLDNYGYNYSSSATTNNDPSLVGAYGGIILEPMLAPLKPIHVSFPILIGAGVATTFDNNYYYSYNYAEDFYTVVEPGIELEVNFTKWLRFAAYGTYRYTSKIDIDNVSPDALRSYSVGLIAKIGLF